MNHFGRLRAIVPRTSSDLPLNQHSHVVFVDGAYHEPWPQLARQALGQLGVGCVALHGHAGSAITRSGCHSQSVSSGFRTSGKSTLFNALSSKQAEAANYAFCTIEPNVGVVPVPDARFDALVKVVEPEHTVPATVDFVDIAGLVRGASKGEGRGNAFLANIRECDAIAHVVRCFEDDNILHVDNRVNPADDVATIHTELILTDLETVQKRLDRARRASPRAAMQARRRWSRCASGWRSCSTLGSSPRRWCPRTTTKPSCCASCS